MLKVVSKQGRNKLFMLADWIKMQVTMIGWWRKVLKLHWLKCPKAVREKWHFDQNRNDSKSHIISFSFNLWFVSRKSQNQQKLARKITHFTYFNQITYLQYNFAQKSSLILWTSTHSTLLKIYSRSTAKNLTRFTNFPANMF